MKNITGILREAVTKRGEKRVAITPDYAKSVVDWGYKLIVQPARNPETGEIKRAFDDEEYRKIGAVISEDLSAARVIFGLKEIPVHRIIPGKAYYFFSHTHKGQQKNRKMLKRLKDTASTVIDYELITNERNQRLITAFTYNAGYAGMVDTLWSFGKRLQILGIDNVFSNIPQAVEGEDLLTVKNLIKDTAERIKQFGTPESIPPVIVCFLGKGKTAHGARTIFDLLPHENIAFKQAEHIFNKGSRKKLYALQLDTSTMFKPKTGSKIIPKNYHDLFYRERRELYYSYPQEFESRLDEVLPFITVLVNCINWSPQYPRTVTKEMMKRIYRVSDTLKVIGDITCDPEGSIEFSKETWIDNPVYIYDPFGNKFTDGFAGEGIAVMAVTNLPCEFSADASRQFSHDLFPFLPRILEADYNKKIEKSGLPPEVKRAVILWNGSFTENYSYMKSFIKDISD